MRVISVLLLNEQDHSLIRVLLLPGAFQAVTSHLELRATVIEVTGPEPLSFQKEKNEVVLIPEAEIPTCFWSPSC